MGAKLRVQPAGIAGVETYRNTPGADSVILIPMTRIGKHVRSFWRPKVLSNTAKMGVLLAILMLLASCSQPKTITRDELRSDLTSAASFAAEAETFLDYVQQGRASREFANGQIAYLSDEVDRSARELRAGDPAAGTEQHLRQGRRELDLLDSVLTALRPRISDPASIAAANKRIANIRKAIEKAKSSL